MTYDTIFTCRSKSKYKKLPPSNIKRWIEYHFPDFKPRKDGEEYLINNPFDGDTNHKFNINVEKAVCHDWRSDEWAGPVNPTTNKRNCSFINFVKLYLKCTYQEALRTILDASDDIDSYSKPSNADDIRGTTEKFPVTLPHGVSKLSNSTDQQAKILIKWLQSRGYELQEIDNYDLLHLGMDVYWPYYEFDILVYWQSRNKMRKAFKFPDVNIYDNNGTIIGKTDGTKGDFLYGFDECQSASYLIITESIFGQCTLGEQTLASGGAAITENQLKKLKILGPRKGIILSPDNDKAGVKSLLSNYQLIKNLGFPVYFSLPPKITYKNNDGESSITKDWNELITGLHLTRPEIRKIHDDNIKPFSYTNINKLYSFINQ